MKRKRGHAEKFGSIFERPLRISESMFDTASDTKRADSIDALTIHEFRASFVSLIEFGMDSRRVTTN